MGEKQYLFDRIYPYPGAQAILGGMVAVRDGDISWIGPAPEGASGVYVPGTALPGFIDSHVHLTATGLDLLALNAGEFDNLQDLFHAIHGLDSHQVGLVRVWGYDHDNYRERRYPTLQELDEACPRNMLWINHIESHGTLVNSHSLKALEIESQEALLVGEANQKARYFFLGSISAQERAQAVFKASELAISKGVTTLHAMEGGKLFHNKDVEAVLELSHRLPLDVVIFPQVTDVDWAMWLGLKQIGGCLPLDGSSGVYTAALTRPYYQRSDYGLLYFCPGDIQNFVLRAQQADLQVAMHACGDAAIDQALDAFEYARHFHSSDINHRIEHFEIPRADQVQRCSELGVILSMQPSFDWFWRGPHGDYARTLGPDRWQDVNPVGWATEAGLIVAGGSDSGVTPLDPLLGIQAAISHHNRQQRINLTQAISMFTENGARAARTLDRGRLEPGKLADIVVLVKDPWETPTHEIKDIPIEATMKRGQIVWRKENTAQGR